MLIGQFSPLKGGDAKRAFLPLIGGERYREDNSSLLEEVTKRAILPLVRDDMKDVIHPLVGGSYSESNLPLLGGDAEGVILLSI